MATFSITGEHFTERIRDYWASQQYSKAIKFGLDSIEGMTLDYLREIIDGEKQLVGVDLDFVVDTFKPDVTYLEMFEYADMNQNVYSRIYDEDMKKGLEIISHFTNWQLNYNDSTSLSKAYQWKQLLPDVRNTLVDDFKENGYPYWLSMFLRKSQKEEYRKKMDGTYIKVVCDSALENKTLLYTFYDDIHNDKDKFDAKCEELFIIDTDDEIWESISSLSDRLKEPTKDALDEIRKEALVKDITMTSKDGWLSPSGLYYICKHGGHQVLGKYICEKFNYEVNADTIKQFSYADVLIKFGWIQIHQPERWARFRMTHKNKLTADQKTKIERYEAKHKLTLEDITI